MFEDNANTLCFSEKEEVKLEPGTSRDMLKETSGCLLDSGAICLEGGQTFCLPEEPQSKIESTAPKKKRVRKARSLKNTETLPLPVNGTTSTDSLKESSPENLGLKSLKSLLKNTSSTLEQLSQHLHCCSSQEILKPKCFGFMDRLELAKVVLLMNNSLMRIGRTQPINGGMDMMESVLSLLMIIGEISVLSLRCLDCLTDTHCQLSTKVEQCNLVHHQSSLQVPKTQEVHGKADQLKIFNSCFEELTKLDISLICSGMLEVELKKRMDQCMAVMAVLSKRLCELSQPMEPAQICSAKQIVEEELTKAKKRRLEELILEIEEESLDFP